MREEIERAKETGLAIAIIGVFLGLLFAVVVWFDRPRKKGEYLIPFMFRKREDTASVTAPKGQGAIARGK